jgi:hypothetical protein
LLQELRVINAEFKGSFEEWGHPEPWGGMVIQLRPGCSIRTVLGAFYGLASVFASYRYVQVCTCMNHAVACTQQLVFNVCSTGKHRHGAGSWTTTPPTRDASCRIEAMPELYRLETMEGALQLPCRGRRCTDVNSHQPSGPVSRPDAAEGGPRVRPTLITVERCSHVRAMDSSTGDVKRRHYCNPQRLAPTLRFTGGAVHTGLIPVRDPSLGL